MDLSTAQGFKQLKLGSLLLESNDKFASSTYDEHTHKYCSFSVKPSTELSSKKCLKRSDFFIYYFRLRYIFFNSK